MPPPSKIAKLPEEVRAWLHRAFVERAFGDIEAITAELNAKLREGGVAVSVGKSAVGAESQKVKRAQEAIRASTEAAKVIADMSRDDADARGEAVMALISTDLFECLLQAREAETIDDPIARMAAMSDAANAAARLTRARVNQSKWRTEVDARAKTAAEKVERLAKKGGLDAKTVAEIRSSILGITKREPAAAPPAQA